MFISILLRFFFDSIYNPFYTRMSCNDPSFSIWQHSLGKKRRNYLIYHLDGRSMIWQMATFQKPTRNFFNALHHKMMPKRNYDKKKIKWFWKKSENNLWFKCNCFRWRKKKNYKFWLGNSHRIDQCIVIFLFDERTIFSYPFFYVLLYYRFIIHSLFHYFVFLLLFLLLYLSTEEKFWITFYQIESKGCDVPSSHLIHLLFANQICINNGNVRWFLRIAKKKPLMMTTMLMGFLLKLDWSTI